MFAVLHHWAQHPCLLAIHFVVSWSLSMRQFSPPLSALSLVCAPLTPVSPLCSLSHSVHRSPALMPKSSLHALTSGPPYHSFSHSAHPSFAAEAGAVAEQRPSTPIIVAQPAPPPPQPNSLGAQGYASSQPMPLAKHSTPSPSFQVRLGSLLMCGLNFLSFSHVGVMSYDISVGMSAGKVSEGKAWLRDSSTLALAFLPVACGSMDSVSMFEMTTVVPFGCAGVPLTGVSLYAWEH